MRPRQDSKRKRKSESSRRRRPFFEALEDRRLLAANVVWPNDGTFTVAESPLTPGSNDEVVVSQTGNPGEWKIEGPNNTGVQLNGAGVVAPFQIVNNIFGNITLGLGGGTNSLTIGTNSTFPTNLTVTSTGINDTLSMPGAGAVTVLGNVQIINGAGTSNSLNDLVVIGNVDIRDSVGNTNAIVGASINGGLWVSKAIPVAGPATLHVTNSQINGPAVITNVNGVAGGDTTTTITNSAILGQPTLAPAGLPGSVPFTPFGMALQVTNGAGNDKLSVLGDSEIGTFPVFNIVFPAPLPGSVLAVNNGAGGSVTTFGPVSSGDASRVDINGNMTIGNGTNLPGVVDMASFNQTDVDGYAYIYNDGGPGATNTLIANSNFGTYLAPAGPGVRAGELVVVNDNGEDSFTMTNSTAWWGLYINNDNLSGGATPWNSNTQIQNSNIGTRPGGPSNIGAGGAGLAAAVSAAFGGAAIGFPGIANGDALYVGGGAGNDVVNVNPTEIGGMVNLQLFNGNNSVSLQGSSTANLTYSSIVIATGTGNDNVLIENISIPISINISLGAGNDVLNFAGNTVLPAFNVGTSQVAGGPGSDELIIGDDVVLPVDFFTLLGLLSGFNP